jgi:hypothetical protein
MKKISSKIIISVLLAVFLWSGIGFGIFTVNKSYAEDAPTFYSSGLQSPADNASNLWPTTEPATVEIEVPKSDATQNIDSANLPVIQQDNSSFGTNRPATEMVKLPDGTIHTGGNAVASTEVSSWGGFTAWVADIVAGVVNLPGFATASGILYVIGVIEAFFVVIASAIFDGMMILTIQKFSAITASSGIDVVWAVFRDIINIFFIFILLYTSIRIITGTASGKIKSMVANVIAGNNAVPFCANILPENVFAPANV